MREFMYDISSIRIAVFLFVAMVLAIELGYYFGRGRRSTSYDGFKTHVNAIAASLVGILALLLGFTLSLSLQRFDKRSEVVVEEANAIGTTYLRSQLLPASIRSGVQKLLREYLEVRVQASGITLTEDAERGPRLAKAAQTQTALWEHARQAAEQDPNPVTSGLFIQSLNELIDVYGKRRATLDRHVPEVVLLLLFGTFLMAGAVVGYSSGVAGHRASFVTYILVALIAILVFIILDLDRPRRGLIRVSQESLVSLQTTINAGTKTDPRSIPADLPPPAHTESRSTPEARRP